MHPTPSKAFTALQRIIQKCFAIQQQDSISMADGQPGSCFFAYLASPPMQACHQALELQEVLIQVFQHLDSRTLCTSIPLVCSQWREAAGSEQLWTARCDTQLLAAVGRSNAASSPNVTSSGRVDSTNHPYTNATGNNSCSSQAIDLQHPTVRLPLLCHAVYGCNLLRNPLFQTFANSADYNRTQRGMQHALLSTEQRRNAWVVTVGSPVWQESPAGVPGNAVQPPLPYPGQATPRPSRLQWLFGWPGAAAVASGSGAEAGSGSGSSCGSDRHGEATECCAVASTPPVTSCLETGSNWAEIVQVIDLMAELTARGLDPHTAAAVLDKGGLALGFSVWVATEQQCTAATAAVAPGSAHNSSSSSPHTASCFQERPARSGPAGAQSDGTAVGAAAAAPVVPAGTARSPPAQFAAALMLDDGQVPLRNFQTFVRRDSSHHFFSKRLAVYPQDGWRRYAYLLPSCPKGCRRVMVLLRGRGQGPVPAASSSRSASAAAAAGSVCGPDEPRRDSGVKFASCQLVYVRRDEVDSFGAEECLAGWADRVVQGL